MPLVTRRTLASGLGLSALAPAVGALAQGGKWPEKPIKLVVPFPPGGGADFAARVLGVKMGEGLGQPIIVENKAGAGTTIANEAVAKAAPDGYTLLQPNRDMTISPSIYASLAYDTVKGFAWIGKAGDGPFILCVNPNVPARSLAELVALAKAQPGRVAYGQLGVGGIVHMNMESLMRHLGIELLPVPYKGAGPALSAAISGELQVTMTALTGALPFVRDGKLRALAVGLDERSVLLPDVPTVAEAGGGEGTVVPTFFGFAAPAGTPRPIIERISAELRRVMSLPEIVDKLIQGGTVPAFSTPEQFQAQITADVERFGKLAKAIGIQPQ